MESICCGSFEVVEVGEVGWCMEVDLELVVVNVEQLQVVEVFGGRGERSIDDRMGEGRDSITVIVLIGIGGER